MQQSKKWSSYDRTRFTGPFKQDILILILISISKDATHNPASIWEYSTLQTSPEDIICKMVIV